MAYGVWLGLLVAALYCDNGRFMYAHAGLTTLPLTRTTTTAIDSVTTAARASEEQSPGKWPFNSPPFWPVFIKGNDTTMAPAGDEVAVPLSEEPCQWPGNTICTDHYAPLCVTDLRCIYAVRNECVLRQTNCGCQKAYVVNAKFCHDFMFPHFKRCNLKLFIQ